MERKIVFRSHIKDLLHTTIDFLFPNYFNDTNTSETISNLKKYFNQVLEDINEKSYSFSEFIIDLNSVKVILETDIDATFNGDPAAKSKEEIIVCYPGFYAILVYRIAHLFYLKKIEIVSRIMSEMAHSKTGIDIHPGANIGKSFFIDHGTGVVIGETSIIGNNVRIYQGVTIGALSLINVDELRNSKRHPTIKDNVIIYANASILGGDTVIGEDCIIGGNVFITSSIEPKKIITLESKNYSIKDIKKSNI